MGYSYEKMGKKSKHNYTAFTAAQWTSFPHTENGSRFIPLNAVVLQLFESHAGENWAGLQSPQAFWWHMTGTAGLQPIAVGESPVRARSGRLVSDYTDFSKLLKTSRRKAQPKFCYFTAPQSALGVPGSSVDLQCKQVAGSISLCMMALFLAPKAAQGQKWSQAHLHELLWWWFPQNIRGFSMLKGHKGSVSKAPTIPWCGRERFLSFGIDFVKFPLEHQWW